MAALKWPNLSLEGIKRLDQPLLRSMVCGQIRTGPQFTLVMKASFIYFGLMGNIMFPVKLGPEACEEVSERWRRKCHGLGGVFCSRSWSSNTATWQSECKCLSEPSSTTYDSSPALLAQSANHFHAGQGPLSRSKMGKAVPWSWKHWNNEIAIPESWSKPKRKLLDNSWWQSYG